MVSYESADARRSNSCSGLSEEEFTELRLIAKTYLDATGLFMKLVEMAGRVAEGLLGEFPAALRTKLEDLAYLALMKAYDAALWGDRRGLRNSWWPESILAWANSETWHRAVVAVTGALGEIGGAATTVVELPVTTALILHSVQQIAISYGKDPSDLEVRQQCIAVFALGGSLEDDADTELGFWGVRFGVGQQTVAQLIARVAPRFGVAVSEKFLAEAAPVLGAAGGAFVNFTFAEFYQKMAHVHFRLQALEGRHERDQVKSCFQRIVADLRQ